MIKRPGGGELVASRGPPAWPAQRRWFLAGAQVMAQCIVYSAQEMPCSPPCCSAPNLTVPGLLYTLRWPGVNTIMYRERPGLGAALSPWIPAPIRDPSSIGWHPLDTLLHTPLDTPLDTSLDTPWTPSWTPPRVMPWAVGQPLSHPFGYPLGH